jgi:hypothetical protein
MIVRSLASAGMAISRREKSRCQCGGFGEGAFQPVCEKHVNIAVANDDNDNDNDNDNDTTSMENNGGDAK